MVMLHLCVEASKCMAEHRPCSMLKAACNKLAEASEREFGICSPQVIAYVNTEPTGLSPATSLAKHFVHGRGVRASQPPPSCPTRRALVGGGGTVSHNCPAALRAGSLREVQCGVVA